MQNTKVEVLHRGGFNIVNVLDRTRTFGSGGKRDACWDDAIDRTDEKSVVRETH
jgi:hypothetical protein